MIYALFYVCILPNELRSKHTSLRTIALEIGANFVRRTLPEARAPVLRGPRRVACTVTAL